ncbi:pentapeptide repeat-containing protein [Nostoc sp. CHAB 5784]|uniref:pentapeptide repeat-containing protein n=1 Tax=Nostoc mirabile TaxID=2907820 RepID=UPI001E58576C|nr:pentapeptide repeat-containing protein [Nostoc mirabile]MCC5663229.1 pentapeptide repeat-containing protein [Nostoc mirabile CHAB5784]
MANQDHVKELNKGVKSWNQWRQNNPEIKPDLSNFNMNDDFARAITSAATSVAAGVAAGVVGAAAVSLMPLLYIPLVIAKLKRIDLSGINLSGAKLIGANLSNAKLIDADLSNAKLIDADLSRAKLIDADLSRAKLIDAKLIDANLSNADLSGAKLIGADLSNANLSRAKLIGANLSNANLSNANLSDIQDTIESIEGLNTVNVNNAILSPALKGILDKIKIIVLFKKLKDHINENTNKSDGLNLLFEAIQVLIKDEESKLTLKVTDIRLQELIEIAYAVSVRKQESRYPKFKLYVSEEECYNNLKFIISFSNQRNNHIDSNKLATLARIGIGIPQYYSAVVTEKARTENQYTVEIEGIIKLEKDDLLEGKFNNQDNLIGLFLSVEAPGRLSILYNFKNKFKVHLALIEGKVKINHDPVQNPLVNLVFFKIAKNLINDSSIDEKIRDDFRNNKINSREGFFTLIKTIQKVWHRILQLAVDFGHGSQFVIIPKKSVAKLQDYFNIEHLTTQEPNLGKCITKYFNQYLTYNSSEGTKASDELEKLVIANGELINCIDLIAYLSSIDGCIILDDSLSLIGFGGEIRNQENLEEKCVEFAANFTPFDPLLTDDLLNFLDQNQSEEENLEEDKSKIIESFVKFPPDEEPKKWKFEEFGTRHRSAARLCTNQELDPFVFVVSQTGDIREFINLENKVRILGPLRPL